MIAVVGHLVIELIGGGVQLEHPLDSPLGLVEQVGRPVGPRSSLGVDTIGKKLPCGAR